jgi:predicted AAA+ superfamily ATPase
MKILHRTELDYLSNWLHRKDRKPLIIRGARQVGKSTLARLLAQKESKQLIEIDFEKNPEYAELFSSQEPETIINLLSVQLNKHISPSKSLLFLDEIQRTPELLKTLRYFYEKMPELAVISAGSLLDLTLKNINFSIPVGRIEYLYLGPLTFEAFLIATQNSKACEFLINYELNQEIPQAIHNKLLESVKNYFIVGGLPEAVAKYSDCKDFIEIERFKKSLITSYQEDFAKYASIAEQNRMRLIFQKIPRMLGEKFKYSHIDPEQKSSQIKTALEHLALARLINIIYHSAANGLPLDAEINEKHFKTYFLDIGLASSALDLNVLHFNNISDYSLVNSGKIAEQFIAQELLQLRKPYEQPNLHYWLREQKSSAAEVDFIIPFNGKIIPIEVKAGQSGSLKSLHYFLNEKKLNLAVRFCNQLPSLHNSTVQVANNSLSYQLLTLPFYLVGQLKRLLYFVT